MLMKRIIPCLDVQDGEVVKGVQFQGHRIVGGILELAQRYRDAGADELVFYDIKASTVRERVGRAWIERIAALLDIPFCVAGGIGSLEDAREVLLAGADKISVNSKALERPSLIDELAAVVGSQSVVVGVDSRWVDGTWQVFQYTGSAKTSRSTGRLTLEWIREAIDRGAGEIVLNCMDQDGMRQGYDLEQLAAVREVATVPLIASGGAGTVAHFVELFDRVDVDGALAAGILHDGVTTVPDIKKQLALSHIPVRLIDDFRK
jgi:imidazole glycerol-phosphate synthase subunit HisF